MKYYVISVSRKTALHILAKCEGAGQKHKRYKSLGFFVKRKFVKLKLRMDIRTKDYKAIITSVLSGREKVYQAHKTRELKRERFSSRFEKIIGFRSDETDRACAEKKACLRA